METCYKCFKREVIQSINLVEDRFGFEPEVTAKISKKGIKKVPKKIVNTINEISRFIDDKDLIKDDVTVFSVSITILSIIAVILVFLFMKSISLKTLLLEGDKDLIKKLFLT